MTCVLSYVHPCCVPWRVHSSASPETKDDPGRVTYNLLLKNELLGARVDDMKVRVTVARACALPPHFCSSNALLQTVLSPCLLSAGLLSVLVHV